MTGITPSANWPELLAAQDFVQGLAHSLIFEADRADDVVQETWVAALRNPPVGARLRSWLSGVVHNQVRQVARDASRRRRRERAAAQPEALPSVATVLEREAERRVLVDAVIGLAEPYRSTVLARYFEGLPPAEIGRRRGVPAATVRSWQKRALEQLRERLDREHRGERRAWVVALLPLARPVKSAGVLGSLTAMVGGSAALLWLFAAAAVVGGGWWLAMAPGESPATASPSQATVARRDDPAPAGRTDEPAERQVLAPAPAKPLVTAPDAASLCGFRGRVVAADGAPAAGQRVRMQGIDGPSLFADAAGDLHFPVGEAKTADDGTFRIDGLWPRALYQVDLAVDGRDRTVRTVPASAGPGEVVDLGDLTLVTKGTIVGRVVDEDDQPIAGAEVWAAEVPAVLSAGIPLDRLDPKLRVMLGVPRPLGPELAAPAAYVDRLRGFLGSELFMRPIDSTECQFLTLDAPPWAERLWTALPIARTRTAADGSFVLQGVEPGGNLLVARKPSLATAVQARVVVQAAQIRDVASLVLRRGQVLRGVVQEANGTQVANAQVCVAALGLLGFRGLAFAEPHAVTDAEGSFTVGGLPRGRVLVAVRRQGSDPWSNAGEFDADDEPQILLPAQHVLDVKVTGADGRPVATPELRLWVGPLLQELGRAGLQQELPVAGRIERQAEGVVRLRDLCAGCYVVEVRTPGYAYQRLMATVPQPEPLAVTLGAGANVQVRVLAGPGQPLAGAKVYAGAAEPKAWSALALPTDYGLPRWSSLPDLLGTTDSQGRIQGVDCPIGPVVISATHPAFAPASRTLDLPSGDVELTLPQCGVIEGQLTQQGVPADRGQWRVVAQSRTWQSMPLPAYRVGLAVDGSFRIVGVAPGPYELLPEPLGTKALSVRELLASVTAATSPTWPFTARETHRQLEVVSGGTVRMALDVDPTHAPVGATPARLDIRAATDGKPVVGVTVSHRRPYQGFVPLGTTGSQGEFARADLAPGHYEVILGDEAAPLWMTELDLKAGESRRVEWLWQTGGVVGTATIPAGLSSADHVVLASGQRPEGTWERSATVDGAGRFQLAGLPIGACRLSISGPEGKGVAEPVQVVAGGMTSVHVELAPVLVLTGRVVSDQPLPKRCLVVLASEHAIRFEQVKADGTFHFAELEPITYRLEVTLGVTRWHGVPGTIDLSTGSTRGLELRAGERVTEVGYRTR